MLSRIASSLDGVEMRVVDQLSEGLLTAATLFTFAESNAVVSARYAGGRIVLGYLIGKRTSDGIEFSYVQSDVTGVERRVSLRAVRRDILVA